MTRTAKSRTAMLVLATIAGVTLVGCKSEPEKPKVVEATYKTLPPRDVAPWLKGSVFEQVDLAGTEALRVSNYSVVVNLRNTGDSTCPNPVREYIIREMTRRGVGNPNNEGFERVRPQDLLRDPRVAVVRVDALIPPGARAGTRCDVLVSTLPENNTTSLSGGTLWQTDLSPSGANPQNPGDLVNLMANAWGPIFVNPAYALDPDLTDPKQQKSLRVGVCMNGGIIRTSRPLALRVRAAEARMARMVEARLDQQFQESTVAAAHDEGLVYVNVPERFKGDWEHFAGVMLFTFFNTNPQYQHEKAQIIANEMRKPGVQLMQMSYALEALGTQALSVLVPLMSDSNPEIAFHAARAAAFIGEPSASLALVQMANNPASPFRVQAVRTLAKLPDSPAVDMHLRTLLSASETTVRIEAYRALAAKRDHSVTTVTIGPEGRERFVLDIVESDQPPVVFATRVGTPRIAILGRAVSLRKPMIFTAQQEQFSLSDTSDGKAITLFYRGPGRTEPAKFLIPADLNVLLARLGGTGPRGERLDFNYPEIVALLGRLSDAGLLVDANTTNTPAHFILQDLPGYDTNVIAAPPVDGGRPIGDASTPQTPTPGVPGIDPPPGAPKPVTIDPPPVSMQ
ncbi:MAG: flagellar basal body P-ring protein FlgI [Tepidisphaeraceae bacterium]